MNAPKDLEALSPRVKQLGVYGLGLSSAVWFAFEKMSVGTGIQLLFYGLLLGLYLAIPWSFHRWDDSDIEQVKFRHACYVGHVVLLGAMLVSLVLTCATQEIGSRAPKWVEGQLKRVVAGASSTHGLELQLAPNDPLTLSRKMVPGVIYLTVRDSQHLRGVACNHPIESTAKDLSGSGFQLGLTMLLLLGVVGVFGLKIVELAASARIAALRASSTPPRRTPPRGGR